MTSENHLNNSDKEVDEVDAALSRPGDYFGRGKNINNFGRVNLLPIN